MFLALTRQSCQRNHDSISLNADRIEEVAVKRQELSPPNARNGIASWRSAGMDIVELFLRHPFRSKKA